VRFTELSSNLRSPSEASLADNEQRLPGHVNYPREIEAANLQKQRLGGGVSAQKDSRRKTRSEL